MPNKPTYQPKREDFKYLKDTLYVMGGKWTLLVLHSLGKGNRRFSEIKQSIPGITPKMLSQELKKLEMNKLIKRSEYEDQQVRVDYEVTKYCKSFEPIIKEMIAWGKEHRDIVTERTKYED